MLWYLLVSDFLVIIVIMNDFVYVVSLAGQSVFRNWGIQYVIKRIGNLDKVRTKIKENYGIEFEEYSSQFYDDWWNFDNITDDRDIHLIVERVDIID